MPQRRRIRVSGSVQGVGFRPFVYRLARELDLVGFVGNDPAGVIVEVEGDPSGLDLFDSRLTCEAPPASSIETILREPCDPRGDTSFVIADSRLVARLRGEQGGVFSTADLRTAFAERHPTAFSRRVRRLGRTSGPDDRQASQDASPVIGPIQNDIE